MKRRRVLALFCMIYVLTVGLLIKEYAEQEAVKGNLTAMCLENSLPCMDIIAVDSQNQQPEEAAEETTEAPVTEEKKETVKKEPQKEKKEPEGPPQVLIYHTHATESYLPSTAGNYHTTKEANTVREAGNILEESLEEEGIPVLHDKTIHDNPSYDASYERSYETLIAILDKYPSIECVIDLHRDAMAGDAAGPVETVEGKVCASYSYVIGSTSPTYGSNKNFISRLNTVAAEKFDGYTGVVMERPYYYNQELCEKSILLEMGNNRNHIDEVRQCARVYGKILAEALQ